MLLINVVDDTWRKFLVVAANWDRLVAELAVDGDVVVAYASACGREGTIASADEFTAFLVDLGKYQPREVLACLC
jgi:hypothetical protein